MSRPTREQVADARADAIRLLASSPSHELAPMVRVFLGATVPPTTEEAIPVMIEHANEFGNWPPKPSDAECAKTALRSSIAIGAYEASIRAQYATLIHFCGGVE